MSEDPVANEDQGNGPDSARDDDAVVPSSASNDDQSEREESEGQTTTSEDSPGASSPESEETTGSGVSNQTSTDETSANESQPEDSSTDSEGETSVSKKELVKQVEKLNTHVGSLEQTVEHSQERIEELESELSDYQRRNEREHEDIRKYAIADFAQEMLKVKDMLGDAIDIEDFDEGTERRLQMVQKQFDKVLTSGEIERIQPEVQDDYDDKSHRMVEKVTKEGFKKDEIVHVLEIGYKTHDRVIRPARVKVAAEPDS